MSNVIPFPPRPKLPDCERCVHILVVGPVLFCPLINDTILDPTYTAEHCPMFEDS